MRPPHASARATGRRWWRCLQRQKRARAGGRGRERWPGMPAVASARWDSPGRWWTGGTGYPGGWAREGWRTSISRKTWSPARTVAVKILTPRLSRDPGVGRAAPARGGHRHAARPPQRLPYPPRGRDRRQADVPRDALLARGAAQRGGEPPGAVSRRGGHRDPGADVPRPAARPRASDRASGPQAREHHAHPRRGEPVLAAARW